MTNTTVLEGAGLTLHAPGGRPLIEGLSISLSRGERAAIVGRNGVGKSSLLEVLSGACPAERGRVRRRGRVVYVPQLLTDPWSTDTECTTTQGSPGERRLARLEKALRENADLVLLDEPTLDLDARARARLLDELTRVRGALLVVSHDAELLNGFRDFLVVAESGCHHFGGDFAALLDHLKQASRQAERRYASELSRLSRAEAKTAQRARDQERRRITGRVRLLDKGPSRAQLNLRRAAAQVARGRDATLHADRKRARLAWAKAMRRALAVELPLTDHVPSSSEVADAATQVTLTGVRIGDQLRNFGVGVHDRVAVIGDNGSGKSSLLRLIAGARAATAGEGRFSADGRDVGYVAQNAENWQLRESLLDLLLRLGVPDLDGVAACLRAHGFPLALAERPLQTLSPGERLRAALICLCQTRPLKGIWVLDEPSAHLDLLGVEGLVRLLTAFPGGLVVASHDRALLERIRWTTTLRLAVRREEGPLESS